MILWLRKMTRVPLHENTHSGCTYSCQSWIPVKVVLVILSVLLSQLSLWEKFGSLVLHVCVKNNLPVSIGATLLRQ